MKARLLAIKEGRDPAAAVAALSADAPKEKKVSNQLILLSSIRDSYHLFFSLSVQEASSSVLQSIHHVNACQNFVKSDASAHPQCPLDSIRLSNKRRMQGCVCTESPCGVVARIGATAQRGLPACQSQRVSQLTLMSALDAAI